jgi:hypothetical protein
MGPTAISARLAEALAALLSPCVLETSPDRATAPSAIRDDVTAWAVPSTVAP